ncbi:ABC transporter G family ATP-binding protein/permease [Laspinema sp. D1]|uniref:ABC transporter G family ATP-binding protein/permease n=1 Tax=Laspinema palackyanum D2a TaxID=2953684 RepID=A0ABT2MY83_9CYAN|nr:ABC transporter G family ATP-binding protein/permease [Laspinema sp. D2a]
MPFIELKQVSKSFTVGLQHIPILQDINFTVEPHEFVVLSGDNGSGKSTLLNLIVGLLQPSCGSVTLMGRSPKDSLAKTEVGVVLQETSVPNNLTVWELVKLIRSYYPHPLLAEEVLAKVNLTDKHNTRVSFLSGGQKQRLYFALALAGNPKLLILDEPTRNLDQEGYREFWKQIQVCREQGIAILMVTNNQPDGDELKQYDVRIATLHNLPEAPANGQLTSNPASSLISDSSCNQAHLELPSPFTLLREQIWVELLQLFRTPSFLFGLLLFTAIVAVFPIRGEEAWKVLTLFSSLVTLTFALVQLGGRVAIERAEGWLKLLRVTPLPPMLYLAAKVCVALLVCAASLLLIFGLGIWRLDINVYPLRWLFLFVALLAGIAPFAIIGLAISYLFSPQSFNSVAGSLLVAGLLTSGDVPIFSSPFIQNIVAFSPFYHFFQFIHWSADLPNDGRLLLHLVWLVWTGSMSAFIVTSAYQRDGISS